MIEFFQTLKGSRRSIEPPQNRFLNLKQRQGQKYENKTRQNQPFGSDWHTVNVTNMEGMFYGATAFNQSLNWQTQNVTNMSAMFKDATSFNQPFGSNWSTQSVTDMSRMFSGASSFNQPLDSFKMLHFSPLRKFR